MKHTQAIFRTALVLTLLTGVGHAQTTRRNPEPRAETAVLMVSKGAEGFHVEPVVLVNRRGLLSEPASGGSDETALARFGAQYYRPGQTYRLLFGGGEAGSLTVRKRVEGECSPVEAEAELQTEVRLGGAVKALAVSSPAIGRPKGSRRAPTERERAAAVKLAEDVYGRNRVAASTLKRMTTINLTATDLDADGKDELVGSFMIKSSATTRELLFLVAEPRADGLFRVGFSAFDRVRAADMMDPQVIDSIGEDGFGAETFIDQLDLDGDGTGEVLTYLRSFEGSTFRVRQKRAGRWRTPYTFYSYRCGY